MTKTKFETDLIEALTEAAAWKKGKVALQVREVEPITAAEIKAIRQRVAKSTHDFEARFGIPARTLEGWEQGRRKPDIAARILLTVISKAPEEVERALHAA